MSNSLKFQIFRNALTVSKRKIWSFVPKIRFLGNISKIWCQPLQYSSQQTRPPKRNKKFCPIDPTNERLIKMIIIYLYKIDFSLSLYYSHIHKCFCWLEIQIPHIKSISNEIWTETKGLNMFGATFY